MSMIQQTASPMQAPDGYRLLEHLSRGHDLDVWAAWSEERDCPCIMKMLRPDRIFNDCSWNQLLWEGQLLTELNHPHLVRGYELLGTERPAIPTEPTGPVLIMETLTGATLSLLIQTEHPDGMDPDDVAQLGLQLCGILHYLHGRSVLHLDLKPSNIICQAGKAVLLDLSLAQTPGPCRAGMGTVEYMAPEQVTGGTVDAATDAWGLGGVLYRAMTGRRPFPLSDRPRAPHDRIDLTPIHRPGTQPSTLRELVIACFEERPPNRPTLTDAREALREVVDEGHF